jgi:hypothetical protein
MSSNNRLKSCEKGKEIDTKLSKGTMVSRLENSVLCPEKPTEFDVTKNLTDPG